ncbi:MAG: hypothetical protein VKN33_02470 [Candidatus Sericytochromatia bacterium]|nr:hypothetical protein [Candidatus Sericytochromatia bacterium]
MENTITREQLLDLMETSGPPGTGEFISEVLAHLAMDKQQSFSKADFVRVMQGVTQVGRQRLNQAGDELKASATERAHMDALLDAIDRHALPLLKDGPTDFPSL